MAKDKKKDRLRKQLQERSAERREQGAVLAANVARALSDPAAFAEALRGFSTLALTSPTLVDFRLGPREQVLGAVLEHRAPDGTPEAELRAALRKAVIPRFASKPLLHDLQVCLKKAQRDVETEQHLLGLHAATALARACAESGAAADHVFWELPFDLQLTESVLSGDLLAEVVRRTLSPDAARVGEAFAKALAQGEASRELDELGLSDQAPGPLAEAWVQAVKDPVGYHLQLDGALHLLRLQHRLALSDDGRELLRGGMTAKLEARLHDDARAAYEADVTDAVKEELRRWGRARLVQLRDQPPKEGPVAAAVESEKRRAAALLLGLRTFERQRGGAEEGGASGGAGPRTWGELASAREAPPQSEALRQAPPPADLLLRAIHIRGLVLGKRLAQPVEVPFLARLVGNPEDLFALDDYERLLTEVGETNRARRVRRYRDAVKAGP